MTFGLFTSIFTTGKEQLKGDQAIAKFLQLNSLSIEH
jgi:hypothetical protein